MRRLSLALVALLIVGVVAVAPAAGVPEQTPKRGGTVVFGPVGEPNCLNPVGGCGTGGTQYSWILAKVLPPAFAMGPNFTRRPALVSGARVLRRVPFTLTYDIRREARWSDGAPVTSRDFLFTHRAILARLHPDDLFRALHNLAEIRPVSSKTFRVVFRLPVANWRDLFAFVLPQHVLAGHDLAKVWRDDLSDPRTGKPIGSGPFLVRSFERGKQLTLVRNPRYWGQHTAYLERLVVRFCDTVCIAPPPAEALEKMRTGAVDFAHVRDAEVVPQLRRIQGTTVRLHRTNGWEHVTFRLGAGGDPVLRNKLVRQALAYGIDRNEIVRVLWGVLDPTYSPLHSLVALNTARGYAPNWAGYSYRPGHARRLLERAGCRPGSDGIYVCVRERLSLRLFTLPTRVRQLGVELMQKQLSRAGVEVVISYTNFASLESGDFDAFSFAWVLQSGFDQVQKFGCGGSANPTGYCQRIVTAELDQADRILDPVQRARVLNRADRQLARDVPVIPLYQIPWVLAYKSTIRNVVPSPDNLFWNAEDWWLASSR